MPPEEKNAWPVDALSNGERNGARIGSMSNGARMAAAGRRSGQWIKNSRVRFEDCWNVERGKTAFAQAKPPEQSHQPLGKSFWNQLDPQREG